MAEWSQLPRELLELIASRLESSIDAVRFRSVCSAWRAGVPVVPSVARNCPFPSFSNDGFAAIFGGFFLSKRIIFLLCCPPNLDPGPLPDHSSNSSSFPSGPWMIKTEQDLSGSFRLFNPLSRALIKPFPMGLPESIDLSNIRVWELGQEYVLQYVNHTVGGDRSNLYMEKVAYLPESGCSYVLLTIHVSGKLALYRSVDTNWTVVDDHESLYDDVIVFDGFFHAVDSTGKTIMIERSDGSLKAMVAKPFYGGDKKCLVEMGRDLVLVDIYMCTSHLEDNANPGGGEAYGDEVGGQDQNQDIEIDRTGERTIGFKVYKLDKQEKSWVELRSLGDYVLFLGENCAFSASGSELLGCNGNRICFNFSDYPFPLLIEEGDAYQCRDIGLFSLEDGKIESLNNDSSFYKLFWPPPRWIFPASAEGLNKKIEGVEINSNCGDL